TKQITTERRRTKRRLGIRGSAGDLGFIGSKRDIEILGRSPARSTNDLKVVNIVGVGNERQYRSVVSTQPTLRPRRNAGRLSIRRRLTNRDDVVTLGAKHARNGQQDQPLSSHWAARSSRQRRPEPAL